MFKYWLSGALALFLLGSMCTAEAWAYNSKIPGTGQQVADEIQAAISHGYSIEQSEQWLDAIEYYEAAVDKFPEEKHLQYGLRRAKIHFGIVRRYSDNSFDDELLSLSQSEALTLLDNILERVHNNFVDRLGSTSFIAHGTESLYLALVNRKFVARNLPNATQDQIQQFRGLLRQNFWNKAIDDGQGAQQLVMQVCQLGQQYVRLNATVVIMEYIFGGCNALDDYSSCLTPDRLDDLYGNIEGHFVGLGIEIKAEQGQGMLLVNVLDGSPALEGGMLPGEYIIGIDGTNCRNLTTDEAARLLRGPEYSQVQITLQNPKTGKERQGMFTRRAVQVKSIPVAKIVDPIWGIGYIRMTGFQKTSAEELDAALADLNRQGMRALIWDLRGNPGGLLTAAVEVLDRFIEEGVLVSTKGRTSDQNWSYSAHRTGTHKMPLVVLVDENSASASEIVAGCVRDHERATLIGRKTYGKWSVQSIFPVKYSSGLRLTTAKFYSPKGLTHSKEGVQPHISVELAKEEEHEVGFRNRDVNAKDDLDIAKGTEVLRREIAQLRR